MKIKKFKNWNEGQITNGILAVVFFFFGFVVAYVRVLNERPALIITLFALLAWMASTLIFGSKERTGGHSSLIKGSIIFGSVIAGIVAPTLVVSGLAALNQVEEVAPEESLTVATHFYELQKHYVDSGLITPWVYAISDEQAIAVTADGSPFDADRYLEGTGASTHEVYLVSITDSSSFRLGFVSLHELVAKVGEDIGQISHRTLDILPYSTDGRSTPDTLFISFATNDFKKSCRTLYVASFDIAVANQGSESKELSGDVYFQSECFPVSSTGDQRLHQSGGRLLSAPDQIRKSTSGVELLLSVGDFVKVSANSDQTTVAMDSQLGSVLHLTEGGHETIASGLRNPQGMAAAELGKNQLEIITSEHGPRGGDELNLIRKGSDYGWPNVSYGTNYGPNNPNDMPDVEGSSGGYALPLFSWIPSIAPSQILQVQPGEFSEWWSVRTDKGVYGDILVSSLGAQSIFRLRIEEGSVRYVESIFVGQRIRTFSQTPAGKLVVGADSGQILVLGKSKEWSSSAGALVPQD